MALTSLLRHIAPRAHRNTDIARLERRGVVHAVARDRNRVVAARLGLLDDPQLLLGRRPREDDLGVAPDDRVPVRGLERLDVIAREHERAVPVLLPGPDGVRLEGREALRCVGMAHLLDRVDLLLGDDPDL